MSDKAPKFLRDFSKETGQETRQKKAKEIFGARHEDKSRRERMETLGHELEAMQSERAKLEVGRLEMARRNILALSENLAKLQTSMFSKLRNYFEIKRLGGELEREQATESLAAGEHEQLLAKEAGLVEARGSLELARELAPKGQDMVADFYEREQERWQSSEVSWEDIDKHFSAENLAGLPMNEYVALLRRFPQEMVTHVSRRGIRDHAMLSEHETGLGEFHDSFDQMLEAKNLQSAIGRELDQENRNTVVAGELRLNPSDTRENAEEKLRKVVEAGGWASFADFSAVHFAAELVADDYYGSERGNEHFVVFPSALIAAEYDFGGHYTDLSGQQDVDRHRNDVWVWAKEQAGMPIDAGIVFLPKDAKVNPETGSRYELTEDKKPMVNGETISAVDRLQADSAFGEVIVEAHRADTALREASWREVTREFGYSQSRDGEQKKEQAFAERYAKASAELQREVMTRLGQEFGITDPRLQKALVSYEGARLMGTPQRPDDPYENYTYTRNRLLMSAGVYYQEAKQTVSAEEYWQAYFEKYPDREPSKVVYYEGGDPMRALQKWREENGITRTSKHLNVNFKSRARQVAGAPEVGGTRTRFESIAREVIDEHFSRQK